MMEIWKPLAGTYEVSSEGRVRNKGKLLSLVTNSIRYPSFTLCIGDGSRRTMMVHAAVTEAFLGPRPKGLVVNHKDLDKNNNRLTNLEYITVAANNLVKSACLPKGTRRCKLCGKVFEFKSAKKIFCGKLCANRSCGCGVRPRIRNAANERIAKVSIILYKPYRRHLHERIQQ